MRMGSFFAPKFTLPRRLVLFLPRERGKTSLTGIDTV